MPVHVQCIAIHCICMYIILYYACYKHRSRNVHRRLANMYMYTVHMYMYIHTPLYIEIHVYMYMQSNTGAKTLGHNSQQKKQPITYTLEGKDVSLPWTQGAFSYPPAAQLYQHTQRALYIVPTHSVCFHYPTHTLECRMCANEM